MITPQILLLAILIVAAFFPRIIGEANEADDCVFEEPAPLGAKKYVSGDWAYVSPISHGYGHYSKFHLFKPEYRVAFHMWNGSYDNVLSNTFFSNMSSAYFCGKQDFAFINKGLVVFAEFDGGFTFTRTFTIPYKLFLTSPRGALDIVFEESSLGIAGPSNIANNNCETINWFSAMKYQSVKLRLDSKNEVKIEREEGDKWTISGDSHDFLVTDLQFNKSPAQIIYDKKKQKPLVLIQDGQDHILLFVVFCDKTYNQNPCYYDEVFAKNSVTLERESIIR